VAAETRYPRFRFLTTENRGRGAARNVAAEATNGNLYGGPRAEVDTSVVVKWDQEIG
jgi:hypothetical protein